MSSYVIPKLSDFESDLLSLEIQANVTLVLNIANLEHRLNGVTVSFNSVSIIIIDDTGDEMLYIVCPSVVGFKNKYISIVSEEPSLQGAQMTADSIEKCYIEVLDAV